MDWKGLLPLRKLITFPPVLQALSLGVLVCTNHELSIFIYFGIFVCYRLTTPFFSRSTILIFLFLLVYGLWFFLSISVHVSLMARARICIKVFHIDLIIYGSLENLGHLLRVCWIVEGQISHALNITMGRGLPPKNLTTFLPPRFFKLYLWVC